MGVVDIPQIEPKGNRTTDEYVRYLADMLAIIQQELTNILERRLSSQNMREIAGYNVSDTELKHKSGIVGMSGADPENPAAIRFWSGNANLPTAPFRVQQDGKLVSTAAEITGKIEAKSGHIGGFTIEADKLSSDSTAGVIQGGTIRTAPPNNQRIEMSTGSFKGYTAANELSGLVFQPGTGTELFDLFLYHAGAQLVQFYDSVTQYRIRGGSAATGFWLGGNGVTTYADGPWNFGNASVSNFPISAITGLEARLQYLENNAFVNVYRVAANIIAFDSKNIGGVDTVDA